LPGVRILPCGGRAYVPRGFPGRGGFRIFHCKTRLHRRVLRFANPEIIPADTTFYRFFTEFREPWADLQSGIAFAERQSATQLI